MYLFLRIKRRRKPNPLFASLCFSLFLLIVGQPHMFIEFVVMLSVVFCHFLLTLSLLRAGDFHETVIVGKIKIKNKI